MILRCDALTIMMSIDWGVESQVCNGSASSAMSVGHTGSAQREFALHCLVSLVMVTKVATRLCLMIDVVSFVIRGCEIYCDDVTPQRDQEASSGVQPKTPC